MQPGDINNDTPMAALVAALEEVEQIKHRLLVDYERAAKMDWAYRHADELEKRIRYEIAVRKHRGDAGEPLGPTGPRGPS